MRIVSSHFRQPLQPGHNRDVCPEPCVRRITRWFPAPCGIATKQYQWLTYYSGFQSKNRSTFNELFASSLNVDVINANTAGIGDPTSHFLETEKTPYTTLLGEGPRRGGPILPPASFQDYTPTLWVVKS